MRDDARATWLGLGLALGIAMPSGAAPSDVAAGVETTHLTPACAAGYRYGQLFNAREAMALGALFADDADYLGPDGKARRGARAIGEGYAKVLDFFARTVPEGTPLTRIVQFYPRHDDECLVEFEAWVAAVQGYQLFAIDHFTVDRDGKIARFVPYIQTRAIAHLKPPDE